MHDSATLAPDALLAAQTWRYATKKFDASRKIPAATWEALERSLLLTPSSFGLQPWKFVVVTDAALKAKLRPATWNQTQVEESSHLVVFLGRTGVSEADIDRLLARTAEARGQPREALEGYKAMMMGNLVHGPRAAVAADWAARQVYIALGNFMTSAALLGVDTCPIEGLEPETYDTILGLAGTGYRTVVVCAAGYRAADDKCASAPKVRYPRSELIEGR